MKTAITASGNQVTANFDRRFGRAGWFCVYDEETKEVTFYENDTLIANSGAGTKAAEKMIAMNIKKIISGDFGPKAKDLLDKFNIQLVILQDDQLTVKNIIERLK